MATATRVNTTRADDEQFSHPVLIKPDRPTYDQLAEAMLELGKAEAEYARIKTAAREIKAARDKALEKIRTMGARLGKTEDDAPLFNNAASE